MLIFAHRGIKNELPENTMPAFKEAFLRGFGIELDARMTLDKKVVVVHDISLGRIKGKYRNISSVTLAELQILDAGSHLNSRSVNIGIPTIEEVCGLIVRYLPIGQKVAIHLKYEEQTEEMLRFMSQIFENYDLYQKAFIFDLTLSSAKILKKINNKISISLSVGEANYSPTIYRWDEIVPNLNIFNDIWLDEWKIQGGALDKELINRMHGFGKKIYAISPELHEEHDHPQSKIGYENVWKNLNKWGIDGICTAYPDRLKITLNSGATSTSKD